MFNQVYLPSREDNRHIPNTVEFPPIGLDFGTTNSVMAHYTDDFHQQGPIPYSLPLLGGSSLFPSLLYFDKNSHSFATGAAAKMKLLTEPSAVVSSIKRHISDVNITVAGEKLSPIEVATSVISGLLFDVKATELSLKPTVITMTVPYYFKQSQNILLASAAEKAFKEVFGQSYDVHLLPEPVAAAIDFIYTQRVFKNHSYTLMIYDIGGGTCDLTIVRYELTGKSLEFEVLSIDGDGRLGGDDIDQLLLEYICNENSMDINALREDNRYIKTLSSLTDAVRSLKESLSLQEASNLIVPSLFINDSFIDLDVVVTRYELTELLRTKTIKGRDETFIESLDSAIERLKSKSRNVSVDAVLPIGGTSSIPAVQQVIKKRFPQSEFLSLLDNGRQVSVARGAAIYSALEDVRDFRPLGKSIRSINIRMRVAHSLSVAMYDGSLVRLIDANSPAPSKSTRTFFATRLDNSGKYVELSSIDLYQGEGNSIQSKGVELVGRVNLQAYKLYSHGRELKYIPFHVTFIADATSLVANINAVGVNVDHSDLIISETIRL